MTSGFRSTSFSLGCDVPRASRSLRRWTARHWPERFSPNPDCSAEAPQNLLGGVLERASAAGTTPIAKRMPKARIHRCSTMPRIRHSTDAQRCSRRYYSHAPPVSAPFLDRSGARCAAVVALFPSATASPRPLPLIVPLPGVGRAGTALIRVGRKPAPPLSRAPRCQASERLHGVAFLFALRLI
jgi:hypothetical protein